MAYPRLSNRFTDKKPLVPYMSGKWYRNHHSFALDVGKEYGSQYHTSAIYKVNKENCANRRVRISNIRIK